MFLDKNLLFQIMNIYMKINNIQRKYEHIMIQIVLENGESINVRGSDN